MKRSVWLAALAALALGVSHASAGNLLVNPGFETGDFTGWTQSGNTGFTGVDSSSPHTGNFNVDTGPVGSLGFISQTVATTGGSHYVLSGWLQSDGATPNEFVIQFNGVTVLDLVDEPQHGYVLESVMVVGTGNDTVSFGFRNDPGFFQFDDANLSSVPEPTSMMLCGIGLVGLSGYALRRRNRAAAATA
jgi:hypothetical protein